MNDKNLFSKYFTAEIFANFIKRYFVRIRNHKILLHNIFFIILKFSLYLRSGLSKDAEVIEGRRVYI